ncbi:UDP-2,3-diacylglucosamine diphosphatase [Shewanella sp. VB17]|uniref:UDP-2,3-diacylglucosamine diphosphatase n=1 Tax=Shewanella sp. VB17 TaxID=2739432 RepID=UPI0015646849|nr:UDP-2,3-diacylglucosamine diphosphatase [Shewanella sp. VB17]NRD74721.1 UDP-2,3-diacylglucosamine diphosphatase [Shewanella sp. VB17]
MRTLFIGDLHLAADRPDITTAFTHFLDTELNDVDALYILGDLFEVWIGDDIAEPFALELAAKLKVISTRLPIYYLHGNRDFLIGNAYAKQSGMILLPEIHSLNLYGVPTIILHGDSLCTLDKAYQRFRCFRNLTLAKWLYCKLPQQTRRNIARNIRDKSTQSNQRKSVHIMDVETEAVNALLEQTNSVQMIHGHTHRPNVHIIETHSGIAKKRIVVGDWYEQTSVLSVSANNINLSSRPLVTESAL